MKNKIKISSLEQYLGKFEDSEALLERKGWDTDIFFNETDEKTFIAKINSNVCDADGDIVMPDGCNIERYVSNPILLWSHIHSNPPIGKCIDIKIDSNGILAKYKMADTPLANELWSLIKGGFLKATSIGFVATKALMKGTKAFDEYVKTILLDVTNCKRIIVNWTLLEDSLVSIPANQTALIQAITTKSIVLDDKLIKDFGLEIKEEPKVEPIIEKVEPKVELKVELPKEEPKEEPKVKPMWRVVRHGGYVATETDIKEYKSLKINGYIVK